MPCCWAHSTCNTSAEVTLSSISSHSLRSPPTVTVTVPTTQPISSFTPHGMFLWCFQSVCAAAFTFSFLFLLCFLSGRLGRFFCSCLSLLHSILHQVKRAGWGWPRGTRAVPLSAQPRATSTTVRFLLPLRRRGCSPSGEVWIAKPKCEEKEVPEPVCMLFAAARAFRFFSIARGFFLFFFWVECVLVSSRRVGVG